MPNHRPVYYARVSATGEVVTWDPAYMSNNPAFTPLYEIPDEVKRAAVKTAAPAATAARRPSDQYMAVQEHETHDNPNEVVIPNPKGYDDTEMRTTFQSFDNGAQTIAGQRPDNITSSTLPNRDAVPAPHVPPTPPHVPPAQVAPPNHQTPVAPPTLASSLPPPPMTVPTQTPQQLSSPPTLAPIKRAAAAE